VVFLFVHVATAGGAGSAKIFSSNENFFDHMWLFAAALGMILLIPIQIHGAACGGPKQLSEQGDFSPVK